MARIVGFTLRIDGQQQSVSELNAIELKLNKVAEAIKQLKDASKLDFLKQITEGQAGIVSAMNETNKIIKEQKALLSNLGNVKTKEYSNDSIKSLIKDLETLRKELDKANLQIEKLSTNKTTKQQSTKQSTSVDNSLLKAQEAAKKASETLSNLQPLIDKLNGNSVLEVADKLNIVDKSLVQVRDTIKYLNSNPLNIDGTNELSNLRVLEKQLTEEKKELTRVITLEAKELNNLSNELHPESVIAMRLEIEKLKTEYYRLSPELRESAEGIEKFNKINSTTNKVSAIEQSVGVFTRNVGNYRDAVNGFLPILDSLEKKGIKSGSSLINAFRSEQKQQIKQVQISVDQLSASFDKLNDEQKKGEQGLAILNKLESELKQLNNIAGQTPREFSKLKSSLLSVSDIVSGGLIGGGIIGVITKLQQLGGKAFAEFSEAEIAITKVDQILKQTGNSAGFTVQQLSEIAKSLGETNNIDNDVILNEITSKLLVYDRISNQVFAKAQQSVIDSATVLGQAYSTTAESIGKILNNPLSALKQLKKFGIDLTEQEKERLKVLIESNNLTEAQLIILQKFEKFTGQGIALAQTEIGKYKQITVEFNEALETVGTKISDIGIGFLDFTDDIIRGTVGMSDAAKVLKKSQQDLGVSLNEDNNFIKANIALLKDQNIQGKTRQEIINKLAAKYPDLINQLDLQNASMQRLTEIELDLTRATSQETVKRLSIKEKEQLEILRIEKERELIENKTKQRTANPNLPGFGLSEIKLNPFTSEKSDLEKEAKKLESELKDITEKLAVNSNQILKQNKINISLPITNESIKGQIKGIIDGAVDALQKETTLPQNKSSINKILNDFISIKQSLTGNETPEQLKEFASKINSAFAQILSASKDTATKATDEQIEAAKKAKEQLEDQLKRINQLKDSYQKTQNDLLVNEFEKQIKNAKLAFEIIKRDSELQIKKLKEDGTSNTDLKEIEALNKTIQAAKQVETAELEKINKAQQKVIQTSIDSLNSQKDEIESIVSEINKISTDDNVETIKRDTAKQLKNVTTVLDADTSLLDEKLSKGLLSQEKYNEEKNKLNDEAIKNELSILEKSKFIINEAYQKQYDANIIQLKANKNKRLNELDEQFKNEAAKIREDGEKNGLPESVILGKSIAAYKKLIAEKAEVNAKYDSDVKKQGQQLADNHGSTEEQITEKLKEQSSIRIEILQQEADKRQEIIQALKDTAIDLAGEISNTIFEINGNNLADEFKQRNAFLEKEKVARLKLAKGNAIAEEQINKDFVQRKEALDKEQFEREKRMRILEAEVNAALGITAVFAVPDPTFGILAAIRIAFILAQTALQIQAIKSKTFAEGGFGEIRKSGAGGRTSDSLLPPDETGKRPVGWAKYHRNEYTMPEWQTDENKDLVDAFDQDRIAKPHGRTGAVKKYIQKQAKEYAEKELIKINIIQARFKPENSAIPIVVKPQLFFNQIQKFELSDPQILQFAKIVAMETASAIENGAEKGIKKGMIEQSLIDDRKIRELKRKAI